jgi:hypothetical protein
MKKATITILAISMLLSVPTLTAAPFTVGAAPKGDTTKIAARIIKYNFPTCKRVSSATRKQDGSIRAMCDGTDYLVFTVFNAKEGRMLEVAMNCTAAKTLLNVSC